MLLLDTHTWVWSVDGDTRRIGRRARQALSRAASADGIRISPVSVFEIAALSTSGRLRLASPAEPWVREARAASGVRIAEVTPAIAADGGGIPRSALTDPLDRLLVATARQLGATSLTADEPIRASAARTNNVRAEVARV